MFTATIKSGRLSMGPRIRQTFMEWCAAHEGKRVVITPSRGGRSNSQLRMYRAWLHSTASHTGNNEDALHEFLLGKCAPKVVITISGKKGSVEQMVPKRTHGGTELSMNKEEMGEYMEKCAALTGYPLPTPEELEAMGYISNY